MIAIPTKLRMTIVIRRFIVKGRESFVVDKTLVYHEKPITLNRKKGRMTHTHTCESRGGQDDVDDDLFDD